MRELSGDVQKMVLWLFSQAVQNKGKSVYTDKLLPELTVSTDFDFSRTNTEQPIVELTIEENPNHQDGWRIRFLLVKTLGNDLPKILPQMYKDSDWGLVHVLSWCQSGDNEADKLEPKQPDYNLVCAVVNTRIRDAWRRRKDIFPILKK